MTNLTEDIRSDLTKIFSERNEVTEEHVPSETIARYAEEIQEYLQDLIELKQYRADEMVRKMDAVLDFVYKNYKSDYLDR